MIPYKHQILAAKIAAKLERGVVSMVTGYGKSITMALLINELQVRTLVVVPNLNLKEQLMTTFRGIFGGTKHIVIENIASPKLNKLKDFDCIIWDEVHHAASATYHRLNLTAWKNIYFRIGFTATPFRSDENEELLLQSIAGDVIYEVGYHQAVNDGVICAVEAFYVNLHKIPVEGFTWNEVYNELVINRQDRNEAIAYLMLKLQAEGKSTLCLVKELKHGNILSKMTGIEFANGVDGSIDLITAFNGGAIKTLIATEGVMAEGIDSKPAEYIIIAGLGKAKSAFMQKVGRTVRKYPGKETAKVILFRDPSHRWTLSHFKAQTKILLTEYNVKPIKLDI